MISRIFVLLLLISTFSFGQPNSILFIGNSFTHMNNLCKMYEHLANSKGKKVIADTLAVSGSTIQGHTQRNHTYDKIKSKNWNYVVIQGFSREFARDSATIAISSIPFTKMLIDSIKKYNPCVNIYYYMTWGYANGFTDSIPNDTYQSMQERIQSGYLQLSNATGKFPIAPVGMVWKQLREQYPELNLYNSDNAHPNPVGSYVAACTFFSSIYKESPLNGAHPSKIEQVLAQKVQECANNYVLSNVAKFNLDTVQGVVTKIINPKIGMSVNTKWLSISVKSVDHLKGKHEYFWDFGDGKYATSKQVKHYYSKSGTYTVTLSIKDGCNWFETKKVIVVSDKPKQSKKGQKH